MGGCNYVSSNHDRQVNYAYSFTFQEKKIFKKKSNTQSTWSQDPLHALKLKSIKDP